MGPGFKVFLHHLVAGSSPHDGSVLYFLDGNPGNASLPNLAWISQSSLAHQQVRPKRSSRSSEFIGVRQTREGRYFAALVVDGRTLEGPKRTHEGEAAEDFDAIALQQHGPWARLNFEAPPNIPPKPTLDRMGFGFPLLEDGRPLIVEPWAAPLVGRHRWQLHAELGPVTRIGDHTVQLAWLLLGTPRFAAFRPVWADGDKLNCRAENLQWERLPSARHQQVQSKRSRAMQRKLLIGVRATPAGRFMAECRVFQDTLYLGTFDTEEEAGRAYDRFAAEKFGPGASLNFSDGVARIANEVIR
jgi:hypothetical protein